MKLPTAPLTYWRPPDTWWRLETLDAHTEGEPFRVILSGYPVPRGETILERRRYLADHYDHLRRALMLEPRGHADMYGAVVTPPASPDGDLGVLFMHNEGYSTMCGHGIIALATVLAETGFWGDHPIPDPIRIDAPAGRIEAEVVFKEGRVHEVAFRNVPSFVDTLDARVEVEGLGVVTYDLAYGGAYYAYVDAASIGLETTPAHAMALINAGKRIKKAVMASRTITHPTEPDLGFLYGVIFTGPAASPDAHSRHVCVFAEGEVDRSPTGTGVSARLALLHARGTLDVDQPVVIESIIGSRFRGTIVEKRSFGGYDAIIPEVAGRAFITGRHSFFIDPADPLKDGFMIR